MKLIYQTYDFTNATKNVNSTDQINKTDNFTDKNLIENLADNLTKNLTSNSTRVENETYEIEHTKENCNKTDVTASHPAYANGTQTSGCDNSDEKGFPSYPIFSRNFSKFFSRKFLFFFCLLPLGYWECLEFLIVNLSLPNLHFYPFSTVIHESLRPSPRAISGKVQKQHS